MSHTPGPWGRRKEWSRDTYALEIYPAGKNFKTGIGVPSAIAMVDDIYGECVDNARLIAAAPELLETLRALTQKAIEDSNGSMDLEIERACAAIRNVTGAQ